MRNWIDWVQDRDYLENFGKYGIEPLVSLSRGAGCQLSVLKNLLFTSKEFLIIDAFYWRMLVFLAL